MTSRANPPTLAEVVERVRNDEFPDLAPDLVASVLEAQVANSESPQEAIQESGRVLRQWLAQNVALEEDG